MTQKSKVVLISLIFILGIFILTSKVEAANGDVVDIQYMVEDEYYIGKKVYAYKIADLSASDELEIIPELQEFNIDLVDVYNPATSSPTCNTISGYIIEKGLAPTTMVTTNSSGMAQFNDLDSGLYLVETERTYTRDLITMFRPFFMQVPTQENVMDDTGNKIANYIPKYALVSPVYDRVDYKVVVSWQDRGAEAQRPSKVGIIVYKDGAEYQRFELSKNNNWTATWNAYDDGSVWSVVQEGIPNSYQVLTEENGYTFYITNVRKTNNNGDGSGEGSENGSGKGKNPVTGEDMTIFIFAGMAVISGLGLLITSLSGRKKE